MPKTRARNPQKGAKSLAKRIKFKIGGRKSEKGVKQMSFTELTKLVSRPIRPRDTQKIINEMVRRA